MLDNAVGNFTWLFHQWWAWLAFFVSIPIGWYLFSQRQYREQNGRLLVRHGRLGQWIDVENHLRDDH
jgi:hypothetical protein